MVDIKEGFLTKQELLKSYHAASGCLHAGEIKDIVVGRYKYTNRLWMKDWAKKLIALLDHHTIYLKDGPGAWDGKEPFTCDNGEQAPKYQIIIAMKSGPDQKPAARLFEVIGRLEDQPQEPEPRS